MNTRWIMGMLAMSNVALAAGGEESQTITEYFVDGADSGERLYVGFSSRRIRTAAAVAPGKHA